MRELHELRRDRRPAPRIPRANPGVTAGRLVKPPVEADAAGAIGVLLGAGLCGIGGWPVALAVSVIYWGYVIMRHADEGDA